jgi:hypothetical protein
LKREKSRDKPFRHIPYERYKTLPFTHNPGHIGGTNIPASSLADIHSGKITQEETYGNRAEEVTKKNHYYSDHLLAQCSSS